MEMAHQAYAQAGEPEKAMLVVRELLMRDPNSIELRQRTVEYAHLTNERTTLVQAYLELAEGLRANGEPRKADAVFEQVLELDPGNLRANEALQAESPPPEADSEPGSVAGTPSETPASSDGDYVDLGAMVLDDEPEETTRWKIAAERPTGDEEADFARMLSQFKEKVAENLPDDDARSHYDLGAAYKDMGLLQEAIAEFQQALRAQPGNLAAFEMLGQCFLEQGEPAVAIRTLERGLALATPVEDDLLGVYYWLGKAHESVGDSDSAREFYEKIFSLDINFKDVTERLKTLR
jgi:tetratricopeptide (TPR) repeat protein